MKNPIKVGLKEIAVWHDDFEAEIRAYEDEHADKGQIVFYGPSNFTRWSARYGNVPLREALPDTEIWCLTGDESTGSTWRYSESYYEMRDAFHMYYMDIWGNRTKRLDEEGLARMHRKFWKE